jgi:hypothetical protein
MSTRPWFVADGGKRLGPYESGEIPGLVQAGAIRHATLVWNEDMEGWTAARDVPEMKLYLRGVPETPAAPASISAETLSKLVDEVTAEVSAEVMGKFDAFTKDAAVTKSGRFVAVDGAAGEPASRKTSDRTPAPSPRPADPSVRPAAAASRPVSAGVPVATSPAVKAPEFVARPAAAAAPVPAAPAPASATRVPSTPSIPVAPPVPAAPAGAQPSRPVVPVSPYGTMPDPFASLHRSRPAEAAAGAGGDSFLLNCLAWACKGVGGVGLVLGAVSFYQYIALAVGTAKGAVHFVGLLGVGSVPLAVSLAVLSFGIFLDTWAQQSGQLKAFLDLAKKGAGS